LERPNSPALPIEHHPLQRDHALTQVLRGLADALARRVRSPRTRALLGTALDVLADTAAVPLTPELVGSVQLGRFEQQWQPLVRLAAALVRGASADPTRAAAEGIALRSVLFRLEHLFEDLVRVTLRRALRSTRLRVVGARGRSLLTSPAGDSFITMRPDIAFTRSGRVVGIGDAKWKRLEPGKPSKRGVRPADVYQVGTYMCAYGPGTVPGLVFYPRAAWMTGATWTEAYDIAALGTKLTLVGVDLARLLGPREEREAVEIELRGVVEAAL